MPVTDTPPIQRQRPIRGASAILLPFTADGSFDHQGFERHLQHTIQMGLTPAINMDTGFGPLLTAEQRTRFLEVARDAGAPFIAGAHVSDEPGAAVDLHAYAAAMTEIAAHGGVPIVFPSFGMSALDDDALVDAHRELATSVDEFLGFELGPMFHPAGRIFTTEVFAALLGIPQITGLKHSSLRRDLEWERLAVRDQVRPDFRLMTGNDLAIDLVVHGSDYLLGLSTFDPEAFARRDAAWASGDDATFWAINDVLQYLGQLAFRDPVPGYRHDAAMYLAAQGRIACDATHPSSPVRPDSDRLLLQQIAATLDELLDR
ncbi:MAG: dihydrodipicolinate synthase family protein [Actinomycetes bacterium]